MRPWLIAAAVVATAACGAQTPTAPAYVSHSGPPPPQMECGLPAGYVQAPALQAPAGSLVCTLTAWNGKAWSDVTEQAEWSTSNPAVGQVVSPGHIRAIGRVLEDVPGHPKPMIDDVQIEILEGTHNSGRRATTINGAFSMRDFWMDEPFTARASKAGYESLTIACAGVPAHGGHGCSGPNLTPDAQALNFYLKRQQP